MTQTPLASTPPCRLIGWLLLGGLLLGGCGMSMPGRDATPIKQYLLEWQPTGSTPATPAQGPSLQISAVRAAAGYTGSSMLYVRQAHQLEAYARHRWADSPARMLEPILVAVAEHSGRFASVAEPGSHARAPLQLDTELLTLRQRIAAAGADGTLELVVRVSLIDTASSRIRASQVYDIREAVTQATPYSGVQAANRAVAQLAIRLEGFLTDAMP